FTSARKRSISAVKPSTSSAKLRRRLPLLRVSSAARQRGSPLRAASSTEPERSTASVHPCAAGSNGYRRQAEGPVSRPRGHPLRSEEAAGAAPARQPPPRRGAAEVAAVARPCGLVRQRPLGREWLVLDEALAPPAGGDPDPLHVGGGDGREPLSGAGLTARAPQ